MYKKQMYDESARVLAFGREHVEKERPLTKMLLESVGIDSRALGDAKAEGAERCDHCFQHSFRKPESKFMCFQSEIGTTAWVTRRFACIPNDIPKYSVC